MSKTKTPHAAVLIWNYNDRIGSEGVSIANQNSIDQTILSTVSMVGITTSKNKSEPAGSFQLTLAPTKNWVTAITPGSWCAILMSQDKILEGDLKTANANQVKMIGRVESVRAHVTVDPKSGARNTSYIVSGTDWGSVFNTTIYVDPILRGEIASTAVGTAERLIFEQMVINYAKNGQIPAASNVRGLMNLWGVQNGPTSAVKREVGLNVKPSVNFKMPQEMVNFFGFVDPIKDDTAKLSSTNIADLVVLFTNVVKRPKSQGLVNKSKKTKARNRGPFDGVYFDQYEDITDAVGVIQPNSLFGTNTFWQILMDNCNHVLNEMITDIRWNPSGRPSLALYRRIRPFVVNDNFLKVRDKFPPKPGSFVEDLGAKFSDVRTVEIPLDEILVADAGTNWRDKVNFVEILLDQVLHDQGFTNQNIKIQSQTLDENAFSREGLRPMFLTSKYLPADDNDGVEYESIKDWKFLLREWHFNTHTYLNGNLGIIGQNNYIQVGDNILFDVRAIAFSQNVNTDSLTKKTKDPDTKILAHVESISHSFTVATDGTRSFRTTISFVRGIVVNSDRRPITDGRLDIDATKIGPRTGEKNSDNVFASSSDNDPDPQKLDGR